jgi:hypothetical protein
MMCNIRIIELSTMEENSVTFVDHTAVIGSDAVRHFATGSMKGLRPKPQPRSTFSSSAPENFN